MWSSVIASFQTHGLFFFYIQLTFPLCMFLSVTYNIIHTCLKLSSFSMLFFLSSKNIMTENLPILQDPAQIPASPRTPWPWEPGWSFLSLELPNDVHAFPLACNLRTVVSRLLMLMRVPSSTRPCTSREHSALHSHLARSIRSLRVLCREQQTLDIIWGEDLKFR